MCKKTLTTFSDILFNKYFDVEKLSKLVFLSVSQLHRKLTALTGLNTVLFMRYIRLLKSKEMLLNTNYTINAVAYDCGFNDSAYFGRIFKQEFGETPQRWREKNVFLVVCLFLL